MLGTGAPFDGKEWNLLACDCGFTKGRLAVASWRSKEAPHGSPSPSQRSYFKMVTVSSGQQLRSWEIKCAARCRPESEESGDMGIGVCVRGATKASHLPIQAVLLLFPDRPWRPLKDRPKTRDRCWV